MTNWMVNHLAYRYFDFNLHRAWVNEKERLATFPLWNLSGQLVGYQQYRPDGVKKVDNNPRFGKYFTKRRANSVSLWGLESWSLSDTLFVVEGVFDATRITSMGCSAVATLSNDLEPTVVSWLRAVKSSRLVVCICDNDNAGIKLARFGHVAHFVDGYKDIGEASDEYVMSIVKEYCR